MTRDSRAVNLNLMPAVRTTRGALLVMIAAGQGAIVSTCSVNAYLPDPAVMDYGAAKAALAIDGGLVSTL